ncbi:hypothetical protein [Synechococcus sp. EJ6-Ellesmere]|nr:hypothetical protein [Synechococcus sp. EJ6-Ellesmere]MCP9826086.1 hypothetical protein [Synechococcus sp. EJ6-Ellesmere]
MKAFANMGQSREHGSLLLEHIVGTPIGKAIGGTSDIHRAVNRNLFTI